MNGFGDGDLQAGRQAAEAPTTRLISRLPAVVVSAVLVALAVSTAGALEVVKAQEGPTAPIAVPSPSADVSLDPGASQSRQDEASDGDADRETPRIVIVEADDLLFAPNHLYVSVDEPTTLVLVGVGQVAHNLIVDQLGVQLHVGPGTSSAVIASDLAVGTYEFYCSIFGHRRAGMFGTLTIE